MLLWGCRFQVGEEGVHTRGSLMSMPGVCGDPRAQWDREGLVCAAWGGRQRLHLDMRWAYWYVAQNPVIVEEPVGSHRVLA